MRVPRKTVTRYTFEMHADPELGTPTHIKPNAIEIDVDMRRMHEPRFKVSVDTRSMTLFCQSV